MVVGKHWINAFPSLPPGRQFWSQFHCCWVAKSCPTLCNPNGRQHTRLLCPPPSPGVCWNLSIESVMLSNYHILQLPPSLLPSIFHSIRVNVTLDQGLAIHCVSQLDNVSFHCFFFFLPCFSSPYNSALNYGNLFSYKIFIYYPFDTSSALKGSQAK